MWIQQYVACWNCYQPQDICRVADPAHEEVECRFPDMVMPLCFGVYRRVGGHDWLRQHFQRAFKTELEYMLWLNVGHLELLSMEFPWNQSSGTFQPNIYMEWNHPLLGLWFHGKFHGILPTSLSIKPTATTNLTALVSIELIYMYFFL
jgi:hypothetical protein